MKNRILGCFAALALLIGCVEHVGADTVFALNRTVGSTSISGTLEIANPGSSLTAVDFVNYNLALTGPNNTFTLTPSNSTVILAPGAILNSTSTGLDIDVSGGGVFGFRAQVDFPETYGWQIQGGPTQEILSIATSFANFDQGVENFDETVITLPKAGAVPEPSSLALLMLATGAGFVRRRR